MSDQTRATLRMAAVLDGRFTIAELVWMSGGSAPEVARAVDEAMAAGALAEAGRELTFRHMHHRPSRALKARPAGPLRNA